MEPLLLFFKNFSVKPIAILDETIPIQEYVPIDLSIDNNALLSFDITNPNACQQYIDDVLNEGQGSVAYGGYLERRNLYNGRAGFSGLVDGQRNIHLGMDFWSKAGTAVRVPISGKVHSFRNNHSAGDYGPTIILVHEVEGIRFHTLYGHLSLASLEPLYVGRKFYQGDTLGTLGTTEINVNYAPHLHFQIIRNLGEYKGDYPGVCTTKDKEYYAKNCPNPNLLLKV
ncbi:peptidoglycan DD-metalloendopeptidase family protein [Flavobacteriaceae bacterium 3-367]|uniref:peptidoglycan DD-metalloendopeptidase family protein n=1 Tax=Eudoraea algarum TaxID=3417568 RepID=UPI0032759DF1